MYMSSNVILAANGLHDDVSDECIEACATRLSELVKSGVVAIDSGFRILLEYQRKVDPKRGKGPGDVFLKWLLQNSANASRCIQVELTEEGEECFAEFPLKPQEAEFDPADRKFLAVANLPDRRVCILQATDCKWSDWHAPLRDCGLTVQFLCPDDVCRFYARKFPNRAVPAL